MAITVKKEEFFLSSSRQGQRLHVITWEPSEGKVSGILQIVHGMCEYVDRYDAFAAFLAEQGYAVIGHDHLGHGQSVTSQEELGYFAEKKGSRMVLADMFRISEEAKRRWPEAKLCIMGHSMGSYFTRKYLTKYSRFVDGAILMGTGSVPASLAGLGKLMAGLICRVKGDHYRSKLLTSMAFNGFLKRIENPETGFEWISLDEGNVERYVQDPLCGFMFTASAYRDFFTVLEELGRHKAFSHIRKDLPVLFVSGEEDPVGGFGQGVESACEDLRSLGMEHVFIKLYPMDRHEILNEADRELVYQDILSWLYSVLRG